MKKYILFFCIVVNISYSQVKKHDLIFIEKEIQECRISINDTLSVYHIKSNLYNNKIKIILKTENTITKECLDYKIAKDDIKKIYLNQNPIIEINNHFITGLNITDFKDLIPNKLIAFQKRNYTMIVLELNSFSYSTVGNCFIYQCFKLDLNGNVIEKKMFEKKFPLKKNEYSTLLSKPSGL